MEHQPDHDLLEPLRTLYPVLLILLFICVSVVETVVAVRKEQRKDTGSGPDINSCHRQNRNSISVNMYFLWLSSGVLMTYTVDTLTYIIHVKVAWSEHWWGGESMAIYLVCSVFFYTMVLMTLLDAKSPSITVFTCWIAALPIELGILGTSLSRYTSVHFEPAIGNSHGGPVRWGVTTWELIEVAFNGLRILLLLALALLYTCKCFSFTRSNDLETAWLLIPESEIGNSNSHSRVAKNGSLWEYLSLYSPFWPCMWPSKSYRLQSVVAACTFLVVLQIGVKALSNYQLGAITTALKTQEGVEIIRVPWLEVSLFAFYCYLPDFLNILRSALWIPMSMYIYQQLSITGLVHVYSLDLEWHQTRKTGEVASALNKGKSITEFLEQILFEFLPAILNLVFASGYFLAAFDAYFALIVGVFSVVFFSVIARMTQWKAEPKRRTTRATKEEENIKAELIGSYKHIKQCNGEQREIGRYRRALRHTKISQSATKILGMVQNTLQSSVLSALFAFTCYIALYQFSISLRSVGEFMQVITYVSQLLIPLNSFARLYDSFQTALINAERMLEILRAEPTVVDRRVDVPSGICTGSIKFENVTYHRDKQCILEGLTFDCEPGTTTALVGESGGGKSTIFDLLCGFLKFQGRITIDGHDIMDHDFRKHIAVVSQDPPLLNQSIWDNMTLGNAGASNEEVTEACRYATILEKINKLPGGYKAMAGPHGKNFSGGERQRLALARLFLSGLRGKNIRLLDEATSALDPVTERYVQNSLTETDCHQTTMIITHRLKTIMGAHCILVLNRGKIVERGTHGELVDLGGLYASMWQAEREPYL
ncbi:Vacuolar ABC heavy metal transporter (H.t1.c1) [Penicillium verhagenii]|uniref:Vacuolar ABC heavy metal transporter (H.t1.c1) n=1 Tax=Penicillium verhagenii TaxID=1562060 RepID=UPI0025459B39|nr:Vacuolar ABC heavy metal transporter (H.t1.c1) [Penicillium verhagenii]KAJ5917494.1 Vacuolar ABC heavy metal transporter (H.t1.c1) [Penicillium verhagenii]